MNTRKLDLNLLVLFDAIYSQRSLTRAAELLCITQPAVSNALARLRRAFDDELFVRTSHGMHPTPMADEMIPAVREGLQIIQNSIQENRRFDSASAKRVFKISMGELTESQLLPVLIPLLELAAPGIDILVTTVPREELGVQLASGRIQMALDVVLSFGEKVNRHSLMAETFVVAARKNHPHLASGLDLKAYLAQKHVLISSRSQGPGVGDQLLAKKGKVRHIGLRARHYLSAIMVVEKSNMLTTIPARYAEQLASHYDLDIFPFPLKQPARELFMYWHNSLEKDPANVWLRQMISDIYA